MKMHWSCELNSGPLVLLNTFIFFSPSSLARNRKCGLALSPIAAERRRAKLDVSENISYKSPVCWIDFAVADSSGGLVCSERQRSITFRSEMASQLGRGGGERAFFSNRHRIFCFKGFSFKKNRKFRSVQPGCRISQRFHVQNTGVECGSGNGHRMKPSQVLEQEHSLCWV